MNRIKQRQIKLFGKDPETLDELFEMVKVLAKDNLQQKGNKLLGLGWNITEDANVSNSHQSPIGRKINWCGKEKGEPRHFKGYNGRVWLRVDSNYNGWGSDILDDTATHAGSGGGGAYNGQWEKISHAYFKAPTRIKDMFASPELYSYDYKIFLQDFKALQENVEKDLVWDILNDNVVRKNKILWWNDNEQVLKDYEFLALIEKTKGRRVLGPQKEYK